MTLREKLDNGDYKTKLAYPTRPIRPVVLGKRVADLTADEMANLVQVKDDYEAAQAAYATDRAAYNADDRRLEKQFRDDVEAEYGVADHPKADLLWSKAWEMGHSSGLNEVLNYYDDLVDLIR